ncbi:helix-turn-helix domain-containing protein [Frankia sp. AgB32]|uniref:helix-turn-helix domain-containing protein n=1 Tax=Frankia sp. AgB32 TaxID=631119 RepID=UPI0034D39859
MDRYAADRPAPHARARQDTGGRLREARMRAGLRQADLAADLGITQEMVSLMEGGHRSTLSRRQAIADLLGPGWDTPRPGNECGEPPGSHPGGPPDPIDNGETMGPVRQHSATGTPAAHRTPRTGVQA